MTIISEKKFIRDTIRLMREFIETRNEKIPKMITENLRKILERRSLLNLLLNDVELGISFFHTLNLYVRARYNYIEELIRISWLFVEKPLASIKMLFEAIERGKFPLNLPVRVMGVSCKALRDSLRDIFFKYYDKKRGVWKKKISKIPDDIKYLLEKNEILSEVEERMLEQIKNSGAEFAVEDILLTPTLFQREDEIKLRVIGLIKMLKDGRLVYIPDKKLLRVIKDE
ncbi:MAG: hypothetical protein ACTSVA_03440 [Candidatus Njordarchaeales archaeon]